MREEQKRFMTLAKKRETPIQNVNDHYNHLKNIDLTCPDGKGLPLIHYAATNNIIDVIIWWALLGLDINLESSKKIMKPIDRAIEKGNIEAAILFLLFGAKLLSRKRPELNEFNEQFLLLNDSTQNICTSNLLKHTNFSEKVLKLVGRIRVVSEACKLEPDYTKYPILNALISAIGTDKSANEIVSNVVVYKPVETHPHISVRVIKKHYGFTPGLSVPDAIRCQMLGN